MPANAAAASQNKSAVQSRDEAVSAHLRATANKLQLFSKELRVHLVEENGSFVEPVFTNRAAGLSGNGQRVPRRLDEALVPLDKAMRLLGLRNFDGTPIPEQGHTRWHDMGTWGASPETWDRVVQLLDCAHSIYNRWEEYTQPKSHGVHRMSVIIPVQAEQWAQHTATYLLDMAGGGNDGYPEDLVTQAVASDIANVSDRQIRRWVKDRRIRCFGPDSMLSEQELKEKLPHLIKRRSRAKPSTRK